MTLDWPFVAIRDDGEGMTAGNRWDLFKAFPGAVPPEKLFIREDATCAWLAFRDFLNGTPEQWRKQVAFAFQAGWSAREYQADKEKPRDD